MAAGGSFKIRSKLGWRAFTLVELVVACAIMAIITSGASLGISSFYRRFGDLSSDYNIEKEANAARRWISWQIYRTRALRQDLTLFIPVSGVSPRISVFRLPPSGAARAEPWIGENIAFKVYSASGTPSKSFHEYNYLRQTMTPAASLRVYRRSGGAYEMTDWIITVSGYGMVSLRRKEG
jgi:prepilin-type N-terminal cleavage/methylation domain-containing protein